MRRISGPANSRAIERGIQQLTLQVREAREEAVATAERVARTVAADMADTVPPRARMSARSGAISRRCTCTQVESDQRTQETLEAVHDTLERLVERLASVETGFTRSRPPPAYAPPPSREPQAPTHVPQVYAPPVQPAEPRADA